MITTITATDLANFTSLESLYVHVMPCPWHACVADGDIVSDISPLSMQRH